jgi:hypothetical protein
MKSTLVFLILVCQIATGGTRHRNPSFSIVGAVGQSFSNWQDWHFGGVISLGSEDKPIHPGLALSGGLQYGPIFELQGVHFLISLESGYTELSPSRLIGSSFTLEGGLRRVPIMIWGKVVSETPLSPFVRLGTGVARTEFWNIFSPDDGKSTRIHRWQYCWGVGAGLNYQISDLIALELYSDGWVTEDDLAFGPTDYRQGILGRFYVWSLGFRTTVEL